MKASLIAGVLALAGGFGAWAAFGRGGEDCAGRSCCAHKNPEPVAMATCVGAIDCKACRTCTSCGHCAKRGGTCGKKK